MKERKERDRRKREKTGVSEGDEMEREGKRTEVHGGEERARYRRGRKQEWMRARRGIERDGEGKGRR